jgi:hypothetical protein
MKESELARIETELSVKLPTHYREFMLAYPQALLEARLKLGRQVERPSQTFLFNDPQSVIEYNTSVRRPGLKIVNAEAESWPAKYLIIGKDSGGNFWCLSLQGRSKSVWFFDHEEGAFVREAKDLAGHQEGILNFIETFNREQTKGK